MQNNIKKVDIIIFTVLFIITALVVFFNMVISPQYPMVYSQYNQSILYSIGKMIKSGKIPYKDVIDHKGIYILLIHYFAELLGSSNHIGLYIIGTIAIFISVLYLYKTFYLINLKCNIGELPSTIISMLSALAFAVMQSLYVVSYGTLQSETFIVAGITITMHYFIKDLQNDNFSLKHTMLYGIICSFILFIKANYNIYLVWIALYIFYRLIKEKNYSQIFKHLKYGLIGIIIGITPGMLYAICNNCVKEMIYYTFIVNSIYSNTPYFGMNSKIESIFYTLSQFKIIYLVLISGMIEIIVVNFKVLKKSLAKSISLSFLFIMLLLMVSTLVSARDYSYYLIVVLPIACLIINYTLQVFYRVLNIIRIKPLKIALASVFVLAILLVTATLNVQYGRDLMVKNGKEQLKVAKFIKESYKNSFGGTGKKLFILGSELYAYDYIGVIPDFRYFAVPMIEFKYYKEPYLEAIDYLSEKKADVVVIGRGASMSEFYKYTSLQSTLDSNYNMIGFNYGRTVLTKQW